MTVKILIETINAHGERNCERRVLYAENGAAIERRIENTIANLKADGYKYVSLRDCFNLELPDIFQRN